MFCSSPSVFSYIQTDVWFNRKLPFIEQVFSDEPEVSPPSLPSLSPIRITRRAAWCDCTVCIFLHTQTQCTAIYSSISQASNKPFCFTLLPYCLHILFSNNSLTTNRYLQALFSWWWEWKRTQTQMRIFSTIHKYSSAASPSLAASLTNTRSFLGSSPDNLAALQTEAWNSKRSSATFLLQLGLGTQSMQETHQDSSILAVKVCKGLVVGPLGFYCIRTFFPLLKGKLWRYCWHWCERCEH